jgi:hypothetical protein
MRKAGAVLTVAGLACLGIGLAVRWNELGDSPSSTVPSAGRNAAQQPGDSKLSLASDGRQSFSQRPSARSGRDAAARSPEPTPEVVTLVRRNGEPPRGAPTLAAAPHDLAALTRELQRGLKRVGCYDGEINGVWTQQSRNAMRAFTARINAKLPVDAPDGVLLALLQGQSERTCDASCPVGESLAADGRCLPHALLAKKLPAPATDAVTVTEGTPPSSTITGWTSATTGSDNASGGAAPPPAAVAPPEGRMALAGPNAPSVAHFHAPVVQRYEPHRHGFGASFMRQLDRQGAN